MRIPEKFLELVTKNTLYAVQILETNQKCIINQMINPQNLEVPKVEREDASKDLSPHSTTCFISSSIQNSQVEIKQNSVFHKMECQMHQRPLKIKQASPSSQQAQNFQEFKVCVEKVKNQNKNKEKSQRKVKYSKNMKLQVSYYCYLEQNETQKEDQVSKRKFVHFLQRRNVKFNNQAKNKIDLGVSTFREILEYVALKDIISYDLYLNCIYLDFYEVENLFIKHMNTSSLHKFDFERNIFCAFDHRFLCMILLKYFPEEFQFPKNIAVSKKSVTEFYSFLYKITDQQYLRHFQDLRNRFNRHWMPKNSRLTSIMYKSEDRTIPKNIFLVVNKSRNLRNNIQTLVPKHIQ